MGKMIELTASDGHKLGAYRADPAGENAGKPRGGIVVIQEIFGVNSHVKSLADGFAADGYLAIAPAMFDRVEKNFDVGYQPEDMARGRDVRAKVPNDAALKQKADAFVKTAVATIMSSRAWTRHSAIFIVADEGDFTGNAVNGGWDSPAGCCDSPVLPKGDPDISASWPGGLYGGALVPAVVIDPSGPRHFVSNVAYNHYSMLRTIEDAWGLPKLGNSAAATPMGDLFP